jgi:hypothetical protein
LSDRNRTLSASIVRRPAVCSVTCPLCTGDMLVLPPGSTNGYEHRQPSPSPFELTATDDGAVGDTDVGC